MMTSLTSVGAPLRSNVPATMHLFVATPSTVQPAPAAVVPAPPASTNAALQAGSGAEALGQITPSRMTSVAPGGTRSDADLVEQTLGMLRTTPSGAHLVDRLLAIGARVNVVSDADFTGLGHPSAHAFYAPTVRTIYLRRSQLEGNAEHGHAAVALAHEGTHLLDDVSGVADPFIAAHTRVIAAAGGPTTPAGAEAQRQALFELTMVKESRAFTFAGNVARELGVSTPVSDPTSVAAAGSNDTTTYRRVWEALLSSRYNPEGRSAHLASF